MLLAKANQVFRRLKGQSPSATFSQPTAVPFHALHKSASMFLYKFFDELAARSGTRLFSANNETPDHHDFPSEADTSFFVGPIRSFEVGNFRFPQKTKRIVQVRDPRDILVSEYFSLGWLHTDQSWTDQAKKRRQKIQTVPIDEYALNQEQYNKYSLLERFQPLESLLQDHGTLVVTYECMVTDFDRWLEQVLEFVFDSPALPLKAHFSKRFRDEFVPSQAGGHKRKITPGDHKNQLADETIEQLNEKYSKVLGRLGYLA